VEFPNDDFADQKAGQGHGVRGQFGAAKAADGGGRLAGYLGWQFAAVLRGSTEV
jgi:hypothetical protein